MGGLSGNKPNEIAEIYHEEVTDDDMPMVKPGRVFNWELGYKTLRGGQRSGYSEIRFRQLPRLTKKDIERAKLEAKRTFDLLKNNDTSSETA